MILRSAPPSPFGRKIKIAAAILGIDLKVEPADTNDPSDTVRRQNPLGKIPVLVLEDGTALFDSRVILEYLDHVAGAGRIIPRAPAARFAALRMQAIGDGIMDAGILRVYEGRWRAPELHVAKWVEHQAGKMTRALDLLEAEPPGLDATPHVGQIAVACALGYLDLRFGGEWRKDYPRLVAWLDAFAARVPSFETTRVAA
ncbi:MAG: glutathione S-transferase [Bradyrhizobiaceae bacterium]|nr:MAG: glutathione S-transferase [Bradyrhizobiaceae bacterium]